MPPMHIQSRLRVLLVEDSEEDAELLIAELREAQYDLLPFRVWSEDQMRASLAGQECDAIISDYHVPGFGAAAALAIARAHGFDGPFIVVSSLVGEETAVGLMKAGAHDFVMKDNLARLRPALERELRDAQVRREKRQAQAELEARERQLRELTEFLGTVREEEQARIARELHDELGQILTSLKLDLSWLKPRLRADPVAACEKVEAMQAVLDGAVDAIHRIAADLRPAMLDDLGLASAIDWQLQRFRETTGAQTELELSDDEFALDPRIATAAYRVVQECLTNAARHAQASRISVSLQRVDGCVSVEVADDGKGFSPETLACARAAQGAAGSQLKAFGLIGLRERVQGLGGALSIDSRIGRGTTVRARFPCDPGEWSPA